MKEINKFGLEILIVSIFSVIAITYMFYSKMEYQETEIISLKKKYSDNSVLYDDLQLRVALIEKNIAENPKIVINRQPDITIQSMMEAEQNVIIKQDPQTIYDVFDDKEIELLFRCVETEVHGGDFESKVHVANVIFNRFERGGYGRTLTNVITSPNQFSYSKTKVEESTVLAVEHAYKFGDQTQGSLSFHSGEKTSTFNGLEYVFTDKVGHHFYRKGETNAENQNQPG